MNPNRLIAASAVVLLALAADASALGGVEPVDLTGEYPGVNRRFDRVGGLLIGGQPDEATLRRLVGEGVTTVVSLRTQREIDNREWVAFDEPALLAELGVRFVHAPIWGGDDEPYRPEVVDALAEAIEAAGDGRSGADEARNGAADRPRVLLHCQSGWRTAWVYGAYLVREKGLSIEEATGVIEELTNAPVTNLAWLLGEPLTLRYADGSDAGAASDTGSSGRTVLAPPDARAASTGLNAMPIAPPAPVEGFEPAVQARHFHVGPLHIAGQPSREAFEAFGDMGVTLVVNLRGPSEMDDRDEVPFDEAALLGELGIEYLWLPLSTPEHPYEPRVVDEFAAALARHDGPVLLHCTVAWRASLVWAAYLVRHRGLSLEEAIEHAGAIVSMDVPLGLLLGREVEFALASEAPTQAGGE
ncbi:MAG: sulfur transferase domain-containing protein [Phycisphaerales bacterium]